MTFKGLSLNQKNLDSVIESFENCTIKSKKVNTKYDTTYVLDVRGSEASLNIYKNANGLTSINPKTGKNPDISTEVAEHIVKHCVLPDRKVDSLYLKEISREDFNTVVEFLVENDAEIEEEKNITGGIQKKIRGIQGDTLIFKHFDKQSLQIHGKPILLFHETIEILSELCPFKEVLELQLKYYSVDLKSNDVMKEMAERLPVAFPKLHDKLKIIISPSLALKKIVDIELLDYSTFAFPLLRGLEGVLKDLFYPLPITNEGFGESFYYHNGEHFLKNEVKQTISDWSKHNKIEKVYRYWVKYRHSLFHVDSNITTTRVLNRLEAETIINSALNIIEEVYS